MLSEPENIDPGRDPIAMSTSTTSQQTLHCLDDDRDVKTSL